MLITGNGRLLAELSDADSGVNITFTDDQATAQHPQFHITPESGWMNDPNGMFQLGALYHVFFQYNPDAGALAYAVHLSTLNAACITFPALLYCYMQQ